MKRVLVMVGLAACGGGSDATTDAPATADAPGTADAPATADATPDGQPPVDSGPDGAPAGSVSVHVYVLDGRGLDDPDATAIFIDPDGTVVQDAQVDVTGFAMSSLHPGGTVIVIQGFTEGTSISRTITTVREVQPGDALQVGAASNPYYLGPQQDSMVLNVPPPPAGTFVNAHGPCEEFGHQPGEQIPINFYLACSPSTFDLLVTSSNPLGESHYFMWQPGNVHVPDGTIDLPDAWQPMSDVAVTYANVPDYLHELVGRVQIVSGEQIQTVMQQNIATPSPGTQSMTLQVAPMPPRSFLVAEAIRNGRYVDRIARFASSYAAETIDFDAMPVPRPTLLTQTPTGASWTETPGTADARTYQWSGHWTTGAYTHYTFEYVVEPWRPGATTTLPVLPAAHADDDPTTVGSVVLDGNTLWYVDYSNTDYDGVRNYTRGAANTDLLFVDVDHEAHFTEATQ